MAYFSPVPVNAPRESTGNDSSKRKSADREAARDFARQLEKIKSDAALGSREIAQGLEQAEKRASFGEGAGSRADTKRTSPKLHELAYLPAYMPVHAESPLSASSIFSGAELLAVGTSELRAMQSIAEQIAAEIASYLAESGEPEKGRKWRFELDYGELDDIISLNITQQANGHWFAALSMETHQQKDASRAKVNELIPQLVQQLYLQGIGFDGTHGT